MKYVPIRAKKGFQICCGICHSEADEGYVLEPEMEPIQLASREYNFLEQEFPNAPSLDIDSDVPVRYVNNCCKAKFAELCSKREIVLYAANSPEDVSKHLAKIINKMFIRYSPGSDEDKAEGSSPQAWERTQDEDRL